MTKEQYDNNGEKGNLIPESLGKNHDESVLTKEIKSSP